MKSYNYIAPTVGEVESTLKAIAIKYNLEDFKQVHGVIGVTDRTLRRWRSKADSEPNTASKIPTIASLVIASLEGGVLITHNWQDLREHIPSQYLMSAKDYVCPPAEFLKSLVGKKNILAMTIKELSEHLHCSPIQLGADIKREKVSYLTFSTILMLCGFKPFEVFKLPQTDLEKEGQILQDALSAYIKEKQDINLSRDNALRELAERYLKEFPKFEKSEARGLPLTDLRKLS